MDDQALQMLRITWQVFEAFLTNKLVLIPAGLLLLSAALKIAGILPSKR